MRVIEERIIDTLKHKGVGTYKLSVRDEVIINKDEVRVYLWDTCIFKATEEGRFYYFSSCAADSDMCMSQTTSSRISAIQYHYGDTQCRRKDYAIYSAKDGSQLKTGVWYRADDEAPSGYVEV